MALQPYSINVASFTDADAGGNNYFVGKEVKVFKAAGGLASIFSDSAGASPIAQDGVANVTDARGEFSFYITSGEYYAQTDGIDKYFSIVNKNDYLTLQEVVDDAGLGVDEIGRVQGIGDFEIVSSNPGGYFVASANGFIKPLTPHVDLYGAEDGVDSTTAFSNAALDNPDTLIETNPASTYAVSTGLSIGTASFKIDNPSSVSGTATLEELNAFSFNQGFLGGIPTAAEARDSKIEVIAGSVRQDGNKTVTSITRSGSTATVTQVNHGYETGYLVYITGANESEYNVEGESITVVDDDTYTFTVSGTPASPATGTIKASVPALWRFIFDAAHEPIGVDPTATLIASGGSLTIPLKRTYTEVISVVAGPDETLSSDFGLTIGSSVGLDQFTLQGSVDQTGAALIWYDGADWQIASSSGQDLVTDVVFSSGNLTINHEYLPKVAVDLTAYSVGGTVVPYQPVLKTVGNTSTVINFVNQSTRSLVTTADTNMAFMFKKNYRYDTPLDGSAGSHTIPLWSGNIWFYGVCRV
jgi:hypothetical protein